MVVRTNITGKCVLGARLVASVFAVLSGSAVHVYAQAGHGVSIFKECAGPVCVGETTHCQISVEHADVFGDTTRIVAAFDIVDPFPGSNTRVPPGTGDLPIVLVSGNTTCTVGGSLPCTIGPAVGPIPRGNVTFLSEYVIQPGDPKPLDDQGTILIQDTCDQSPGGTNNCNSIIINTVQFGAQTPIPDCDDGDDCTIDCCADGVCSHPSGCIGATCRNTSGTIVTIPPNTCEDQDVCTADSCVNDTNPATACCSNEPVECPAVACMRNTECDPFTGCDYVFDCREGGKSCCKKGGGDCSTAVCNQKTGLCGSVPDCRGGVDCNDHDACTDDICTPEGCCENPSISCTDDNSCTTASCNPETGCVFTPDCASGADCFDDDACTQDVCTAAGCCENPPIQCKDSSDCTTDTCDPTKGCVFAPACSSDHDCKDDDACTQDICASNGCCEHPPVVCDDQNSCTTSFCDSERGCVFIPECDTDDQCKDSDECNRDICNAQGCCEHPPRTCDDDNDCTTDSCNPSTGCVFEGGCSSNHDCKDNNACNEDICNSDGCCEHPLLKCKDDSDCTTDTCDPQIGCVYTPECKDASDCPNDSDPCTIAVCAGGCCEQKSKDCCGNGTLDDGETCDPPGSVHDGRECRGDCTYCGDGVVNGDEQCDDGNEVDSDSCSNSCIRKGTSCDDGNPCTEDACVCVHGHGHDGDDDDGDDGDDDDHDGQASRATTKGKLVIRSYGRGVSIATLTDGHHDGDDDDGGDHDGDDDDDDHDGDDDDDVVGQPCDCAPSACDGGGTATGGDDGDDGDDDDDGDDGDDDGGTPTCVCVHRLVCTNECCGNCDDGNPCTEDYCGSSSDGHDGDGHTATGDHDGDDDDDGNDDGDDHDDDDDGDHDGGGSCLCKHRSLCDDGNACTQDLCTPKGCEHPPVTCKDSSDCTTDSCNPKTGCVFTPECRHDSDCGGVSKPCMEARCENGCCVTHSGPCCGNDVEESGETCDPPGSIQSNGKTCRSNCTYCGDGVVNSGEQCDDGNTNNYDHCYNNCQRRY